MANRAHIVELDSPLEGSVVAACGLAIEKPTVVFLWDETAVGVPLTMMPNSTGLLCRKCLNAGFTNRRYVYGVISGGFDD